MKVLHIIDHLGLGGAQTVVKGIFEGQKNNKYIYLFALRKKEVETKINHKNVFISNSKKKYSFSSINELKNLLEKERIDVLHCHLFKSQVIGMILKKYYFPNIKLIFHEHGDILDNSFLVSKFYKIFKRNIDLIITISQAMKCEILIKTNIDEKKIIVLYNFVDLNKFNIRNIKWNIQREREKLGIKKEDFVIGFAGRLIKRKGWKEFIEVANTLARENLKYKFLIAGDGRDKEKILNLIKKYNLKDIVIYLGYQSNMVWFYSLLDIFVIPSHWEPMGLTEIEAQAMGIPIIASNVDGLNEIVKNNKNCLLFNPLKTFELCLFIKKILNSNKIRNKLSKNGKFNSKKYSLFLYINKLNKIYNGI